MKLLFIRNSPQLSHSHRRYTSRFETRILPQFSRASSSSARMSDTPFHPQRSAFSNLRGKTVVLTGGSTGIGAATTRQLVKVGANVIFGDINKPAAESLVQELSPSSSSDTNASGTIAFVPCDVTKYDDIYNLFKTAYDLHGHIDHAVSSAGIFETGKWFDPDLTITTVGDAGPGPSTVIDINVMGTANFSRVAVVFLRNGLQKGQNRSLTLLSSVNAFRESPGLYMYQTSKHAVQGLMRAMRKPIFERDGIRVNCVCPGVTESEMTRHIIDTFKQQNLFWQPPEAVADIILGIQVQDGMNGKAIYVEGSGGWEFEDSFITAQPQWLGEEPTRRMRVNSEAVQKGALTKK